MRYLIAFAAVLALFAGLSPQTARSADDKEEFFNGKNLDGWDGLPEFWSVKDGAIVGSTYPDGGKFNTFLCSKKKYKDFEMDFKVRLKGKGWNGNSGIQIRSEVFDKKKLAVKGPQCDMGDGYWGALYGEAFGGMLKAAPADTQKIVKKDDFNDYSIKCVGKHVTIKINGTTTVDYDVLKTEKTPEIPPEGIIAFQLHAGGPMEVTFKDIKFKVLDEKK